MVPLAAGTLAPLADQADPGLTPRSQLFRTQSSLPALISHRQQEFKNPADGCSAGNWRCPCSAVTHCALTIRSAG
jgi:hypothetical protein